MSGLETGWGLDVVLWMQAWRTPAITALVQVFHFLGSETFFMLLLPFLYWCISAPLGRRLLPLFLFSAWSNAALKAAAMRPRPFEVSPEVRPAVTEGDYGLPSGHAQLATVVGGWLAREVRRGGVTAGIGLYILLMLISRVAAGVHYPQDAVAGLLIGLATVAAFAWLEPRAAGWLARAPLGGQIALPVIAAGLMLAIHPALIPARSPEAAEISLSAAGTLIGAGAGLALEARRIGFDAGGVWWKRALRLLIGLAGVLALRFGLGAAFEGLAPEAAFRVLRYALIGLWVAPGAPWIFVRTGLAVRGIRA